MPQTELNAEERNVLGLLCPVEEQKSSCSLVYVSADSLTFVFILIFKRRAILPQAVTGACRNKLFLQSNQEAK